LVGRAGAPSSQQQAVGGWVALFAMHDWHYGTRKSPAKAKTNGVNPYLSAG
jgi:hypothetical protein